MNVLYKRAGAILGVLFLISILDGCVSGYLEPKGIVRAFPGGSEWMSGKLPTRISSAGSLAFSSSSPLITMEFAEPEGNLWRGMARVAEGARAGDYPFTVSMTGQPTDEKAPEYRVVVFNEESAYRDSFHSLFRKYVGISPWMVTMLSFPLLALCLVASFRASTREEAMLNREGLASIFKVTRKGENRQISFGLGSKDGIQVGDMVLIFDQNSRHVGEAKVSLVGDEYATAEVGPDLPVQPSFLVDTSKDRKASSPSPQDSHKA